jgi:ABC-2 type transport system permease protein
VLLVAAVAGMAILAAKIFRVGILMTGKRPKLKEVLRWVTVK